MDLTTTTSSTNNGINTINPNTVSLVSSNSIAQGSFVPPTGPSLQDPTVIAAMNSLSNAQAQLQTAEQAVLNNTNNINGLNAKLLEDQNTANTLNQAYQNTKTTFLNIGEGKARNASNDAISTVSNDQNQISAANAQNTILTAAVTAAQAAVTTAQNAVTAAEAAFTQTQIDAGQLAMQQGQAQAENNPAIVAVKSQLQQSMNASSALYLVIAIVGVIIFLGGGLMLIKTENIKL